MSITKVVENALIGINTSLEEDEAAELLASGLIVKCGWGYRPTLRGLMTAAVELEEDMNADPTEASAAPEPAPKEPETLPEASPAPLPAEV